MTDKVFNKCKKALDKENGSLRIVCIELYHNDKIIEKNIKTIYNNIELIKFNNDSIIFKHGKNNNIIILKRKFIKYILLGFFDDDNTFNGFYTNKRYI